MTDFYSLPAILISDKKRGHGECYLINYPQMRWHVIQQVLLLYTNVNKFGVRNMGRILIFRLSGLTKQHDLYTDEFKRISGR